MTGFNNVLYVQHINQEVENVCFILQDTVTERSDNLY